jgi:hypothetical protein
VKKTPLVAALAGLLAFSILAADASAMYHPTLGTWLQRDPATVGSGLSQRATAPIPTGGFVRRDAMLREPVQMMFDKRWPPRGQDVVSSGPLCPPQANSVEHSVSMRSALGEMSIANASLDAPEPYIDGIHLYQYGRSCPGVYTDPDGQAVGYVVVAVAAASYACAKPYYDIAMRDYDDRTDKFRHCWVSCKMSKTCGGSLAQLAGFGKEARDSALRLLNELDAGGGDWADSFWDIVANHECIGSESVVAGPVGGWLGALFRESCECCCSRKYK